MTLKILVEPNPILRKKSVEIAEINDKIRKLAKEMVAVMKDMKALGVAAPQVGENIRLAVINIEEQPAILINPKIKKKSLTKVLEEEGCLSLPEIFVEVPRYKSIKVECVNLNGDKVSFNAKGLFARVLQHEIDHLDGILTIDRAKKSKIKK